MALQEILIPKVETVKAVNGPFLFAISPRLKSGVNEKLKEFYNWFSGFIQIDFLIKPIPFKPEYFTPSDPLAVEILAHGIEIL